MVMQPQPLVPVNQTVVGRIKNTLDVNDDGKIDLDDAMASLEKWNESNLKIIHKYNCVDCGKGMKKKSKYGVQVCVDCTRNPSEEMRCVGENANGSRCKRRKSNDSEKGYCGIHMKKFLEPLPFTDE